MWNTRNDHVKPNTSMIQQSKTHWLMPVGLLILGFAAGCDRLPGKPTPEERWRPRRKSRIFPNSTP